MKKVILSIMMIFSAVLMTSHFLADEVEKIDLVVHYQNWEGEYATLGSHGWNGGAAKETFDGTDEFGIYFEFDDVEVGSVVGFIAVHWENGAQNWDRKETGDVNIDTAGLTAGETHHVYVFQGAETKDGQPAHFIARNDLYNLLLVYADPAGSYEENLGVHAWNTGANFAVYGWDKFNDDEFAVGGWGSPTKLFSNGATHGSVGNVKVAMMATDNLELGMLIYAGGDPDKKTGDVTLASALSEEPALGDVGFTYVWSKGNAYTVNDNVVHDKDVFVQEAFSFKLLPIGRDDSGMLTGTFAPRPNQVFVKLSSQVAVDEEEDNVLDWFKVLEVTLGEEEYSVVKDLVIEEVQHAPGDAVGDFVLILSDELDKDKDYVVQFDLGLENEEENRKAELVLDLDREAPVITFISPSEIIGKEAAERIILVQWDQKFDQNKFPGFMVTDDRDGDITNLAYVPKGDFSKLNTNKLGDYKIMLRVEDEWGNVTEETFIFRVTKKVK